MFRTLIKIIFGHFMKKRSTEVNAQEQVIQKSLSQHYDRELTFLTRIISTVADKSRIFP